MIATRLALAVPCWLALASVPGEEQPALRVAAGTTLVRTLHRKSELTLQEIRLALNGEPVEGDFVDAVEMSLLHEERMVVRDTFEAVDGAGPARVRRTFEELGGSDHNRFKNEEGEEHEDAELESALEQKTVVFSRGAADAWEAAFAEGQEGDADLLADLEQDLELAAFLPPRAVAEGDSWEIEARCFADILEPGGDVNLVDPAAEEDGEDDDEEEDELRDNFTGSIRATFKGVQGEAGARVAVIELAIDVRSHTETELGAEEMPEGSSGSDRAEPSFTLSGELRWDLAHGHALALELQGESGLTWTQTITGEFEGEHLEQSQSMHLAGPYSVTLAVERP